MQDMLGQFPDYMQCYLRLACIADVGGRQEEAQDWVRRALARRPDHPDALALQGALPRCQHLLYFTHIQKPF